MMTNNNKFDNNDNPFKYVLRLPIAYSRFVYRIMKGTWINKIGVIKGKAVHGGNKGEICYIIKQKIINYFGSEDAVYYYLVYKERLWSCRYFMSEDMANLPNEQKGQCQGIEEKILFDIRDNGRKQMASIVIAFPDDTDNLKANPEYWKFKFRYLGAENMFNFAFKNGTDYSRYISRWDDPSYAFPERLLTIDDTFKHFEKVRLHI